MKKKDKTIKKYIYGMIAWGQTGRLSRKGYVSVGLAEYQKELWYKLFLLSSARLQQKVYDWSMTD